LEVLHHKGKGTYEVHLRTGHEGPEWEQRNSSTLSLTSVIDRGRWSTPRPGHFTSGTDPVSRRLGGPQGWSGQVPKTLPPPGFDPRTVQPTVNHYNDNTILAHTSSQIILQNSQVTVLALDSYHSCIQRLREFLNVATNNHVCHEMSGPPSEGTNMCCGSNIFCVTQQHYEITKL
jgi:hypothetical protein